MRKLTLALKIWTVNCNKEKFILIQHWYFLLSAGTVGGCKDEPAVQGKCTALRAWPAKHPLWHKKKEAEQWTLPKDSEIHYPNIVDGLIVPAEVDLQSCHPEPPEYLLLLLLPRLLQDQLLCRLSAMSLRLDFLLLAATLFAHHFFFLYHVLNV